jgi:hypothetical protein
MRVEADGKVLWVPDRFGGDPGTIASSVPFLQTSITAGDDVNKTFSFSLPLAALLVAFIGGQAQDPADCSIVAGDLVFGAAVTAPGANEKVMALAIV